VKFGDAKSLRAVLLHDHKRPPNTGAKIQLSLLRADFVAKVENRTIPKISRKLIFRLLCCCVAFQRHKEVRDRFWMKRYGSLTSPLVNRISGSKNFRSAPQKDFCNRIGHCSLIFQGTHARSFGQSRPSRVGPISFGVKQMGARNAGNPHVACDVEGAGDVVWVGTPAPHRRASPRPYR